MTGVHMDIAWEDGAKLCCCVWETCNELCTQQHPEEGAGKPLGRHFTTKHNDQMPTSFLGDNEIMISLLDYKAKK